MSIAIMSVKPTFKFAFPNTELAHAFLEYANNLQSSAFVQHPFVGDGSVRRDFTRVLVAGTGSHLYDTKLLADLKQQASILEGKYEQKV